MNDRLTSAVRRFSGPSLGSREHQVPLLAVWGKGDPIFIPEGARAFAEDLPKAEIHLLDGGHFLLESALDQVVPLIRTFLGNNALGNDA